ncbi:MAG TPA: tetratricopeptide repeat protein [Saprospiraceae bacterium]|nr:tetratricopeptide repeat protein [Saprospiraceae bacterium]
MSFSFLSLHGQQNEMIGNYINKKLNGDLYFIDDLYDLSFYTYRNIDKNILPPDEVYFDGIIQEATVYSDISSLRAMHPDAESELIKYILENQGKPEVKDAALELGSFYYNEKRYREAIDIYDYVNDAQLTNLEFSEKSFKKGYCHFVLKEFDYAIYSLSKTSENRNIFFYPTNYYLAMSQYFKKDYDQALTSFQRISGSTAYKPYLPYYIAQILFVKKQYDELITYAESILNEKGLKNETEIRQMLGSAYFQKGNYEKALPHLEHFAQHKDELTEAEFFQLGFTQYVLKKYEEAKENLLEIRNLDTEMGQVSNYYLADCFEKTGDMESARAAFRKVSNMDFIPAMKEEARFNYGKISAQMGMDREAINILSQIENTSPYYEQAETIINDVLSNSSDYYYIMKTVESRSNPSPALRLTYQRAALYAGLQAISDNEKDRARSMFDKSLEYNEDKNYEAQSYYWLAKMDQLDGNYLASIQKIKQYIDIPTSESKIPDDSSELMARYTQAYNYLYQGDYASAEYQFKKGINSTASRNFTRPIIHEKIIPDSYLRLADCQFKLRAYLDAKDNYQKAIKLDHSEADYAMYQMATVEGLMNDRYSKITTLEELRDQYPKSIYKDDALLALGNVYMELGNQEAAKINYTSLSNMPTSQSNLVNQAHLKLGLLSYNAGDTDEALTQYKYVVSHSPNPEELNESLVAIEEIMVKDKADAKGYIDYVDQLPGMEISSFSKDSISYNAGFLKYKSGDYSQAITAFTSYLKDYNKGFYRIEAHYYRAECYLINKNYSKALKDYEFVVNEGQNSFYPPSVKKAALISYNHLQDFDLAYGYFDKYSEIATNERDRYDANLGAMQSAFRIVKEKELYKHANAILQNELSTQADKATAYYYKGKMAYASNDYALAISSFDDLSKISTNNNATEGKYITAEILYKEGKLTEAEEKCNNITQTSSNYPFWIAKSLILLADIKTSQKDFLNAEAALEAVIENFTENPDLTAEAQRKLEDLKYKVNEESRVKSYENQETLELDTTGNH